MKVSVTMEFNSMEEAAKFLTDDKPVEKPEVKAEVEAPVKKKRVRRTKKQIEEDRRKAEEESNKLVSAIPEIDDTFGGVFEDEPAAEHTDSILTLDDDEVKAIRGKFAELATEDYGQAKTLLDKLGADRFSNLSPDQMRELGYELGV